MFIARGPGTYVAALRPHRGIVLTRLQCPDCESWGINRRAKHRKTVSNVLCRWNDIVESRSLQRAWAWGLGLGLMTAPVALTGCILWTSFAEMRNEFLLRLTFDELFEANRTHLFGITRVCTLQGV
jgi:hypothetical protein